MALSYQDSVRNTRLNAITTALGTTALPRGLHRRAGRQDGGHVQRRPRDETRVARVLESRRERRLGGPSYVQRDHVGDRPRFWHAGVVPFEDCRGRRRRPSSSRATRPSALDHLISLQRSALAVPSRSRRRPSPKAMSRRLLVAGVRALTGQPCPPGSQTRLHKLGASLVNCTCVRSCQLARSRSPLPGPMRPSPTAVHLGRYPSLAHSADSGVFTHIWPASRSRGSPARQ